MGYQKWGNQWYEIKSGSSGFSGCSIFVEDSVVSAENVFVSIILGVIRDLYVRGDENHSDGAREMEVVV